MRFELEGRPFVVHPPVSGATVTAALDEVPLKPLLESLRPPNLLLLFAAVLLERRVLLRCGQYRTLTLAAEGVRQLLFPFRFPHVYVPIVPYTLVRGCGRQARNGWAGLGGGRGLNVSEGGVVPPAMARS